MFLCSVALLFLIALNPSSVVSSECGFQTTELNGTISSPTIERYFHGPVYELCSWNITAPTGYIIYLRITNFLIQTLTVNCEYGWLSINGTTLENSDQTNRKLCGPKNVGEVIRFENQVNIKYYNSGQERSYFTLTYGAVSFTVADISATWIAGNTKTLLDDKERLSFAVPALYLFDESLFNEGNETGYKFRAQYLLRVSEDLIRNSTQRLSLADLSHHVSALLAICYNPRSFRGIDLVDQLRQLANAQPNYLKPFDILTLCSAREKMTSSDISKLTTLLQNEDRNSFLLDFKALAVMALVCVKQQMEELEAVDAELQIELENKKIVIDEILEESVNSLKLHQKKDGGFGSLQTTALVYQALSASGAHGWDVTSAFKFISQRNHGDGSFGNLDDFYAVLPTLKDRTLLHINASNCDFSEDGVTALQEVKDRMTNLISVNYQLWIGDETDVKHTISLRFPNGTSFVGMMRLAAEKNTKYQLKWTFMKGVIYVYEISKIINNPTSGKYWRLYTLAEDKQAILYKGGLENYIPSDGDTAVMWYRTVDLSE